VKVLEKVNVTAFRISCQKSEVGLWHETGESRCFGCSVTDVRREKLALRLRFVIC